MNWILSGSWTRIGLYSQSVYQNQRVLRRSIYGIEPVLTSREECNVFADLFLEFIYVSREILSSTTFFCCSIYIETAQNSREQCNELAADLLFWRLSLCLSRDSLSRDTCSSDLCILFKFISLYLWHIPPHSCAFHTFYVTPIFSRILPREIFFFFIPDDAVARNLIIIFNFSSQRPHLNYIFLSNVYSFYTMEFSMKHKY